MSIYLEGAGLPHSAEKLARAVRPEISLPIPTPVSARRILDVLEARYSMLRSAVRDYETGQRRPFLRFFACEEDLSHDSPDAELPAAVAQGKESLLIICAVAGG